VYDPATLDTVTETMGAAALAAPSAATAAESNEDATLKEEGRTITQCVLDLGKDVEWLTGGCVDVGMWKGVTVTNWRVTALDWRELGMRGAVPMALGKLGALKELWLLEKDHDFGLLSDDVPSDDNKHDALREQLGSGWKVGVAVHDGSANQFNCLLRKPKPGSVRNPMGPWDHRWEGLGLWEGVVEGVVKEGVTRVGDGAFKGCRNMIRATIPEGVEEIGRSAFEDCVKLTTVTIASTAKKIGDRAFVGCTALREVHVPRSVDYFDGKLWDQYDDFSQWATNDNFLGAGILGGKMEMGSFPKTCLVMRLEPLIRATFLFCLKSESEIGGAIDAATLGKLNLRRARDNFRNSGECVGPWKIILTFV